MSIKICIIPQSYLEKVQNASYALPPRFSFVTGQGKHRICRELVVQFQDDFKRQVIAVDSMCKPYILGSLEIKSSILSVCFQPLSRLACS